MAFFPEDPVPGGFTCILGATAVEQNAHIALDLAEYGYILENGGIVLDGPAEVLKKNEDVKEFYLGFTGMGERRSYRM